MRFWIWRSAVALYDAAEKNPQYRCTTTVPFVYNSLELILENVLPVRLYVCTNELVRSEPFLDSRCELWQLMPALYSDMPEKFYIGAHLRFWSSYTTTWNFIQTFLLSIYEVVRTNFFRRFFGVFAIFDCDFAKICGATWRRKLGLRGTTERDIPSEKRWKMIKIHP